MRRRPRRGQGSPGGRCWCAAAGCSPRWPWPGPAQVPWAGAQEPLRSRRVEGQSHASPSPWIRLPDPRCRRSRPRRESLPSRPRTPTSTGSTPAHDPTAAHRRLRAPHHRHGRQGTQLHLRRPDAAQCRRVRHHPHMRIEHGRRESDRQRRWLGVRLMNCSPKLASRQGPIRWSAARSTATRAAFRWRRPSTVERPWSLSG